MRKHTLVCKTARSVTLHAQTWAVIFETCQRTGMPFHIMMDQIVEKGIAEVRKNYHLPEVQSTPKYPHEINLDHMRPAWGDPGSLKRPQA